MSEKKIKLYFDCDTGIDDAMALGYLLAESDKVDILAIGTVCGNVAADAGARNTLELARLAGFPAIPVAVGNGTTCARRIFAMCSIYTETTASATSRWKPQTPSWRRSRPRTAG